MPPPPFILPFPLQIVTAYPREMLRNAPDALRHLLVNNDQRAVSDIGNFFGLSQDHDPRALFAILILVCHPPLLMVHVLNSSLIDEMCSAL
jgi:hypothetical protein